MLYRWLWLMVLAKCLGPSGAEPAAVTNIAQLFQLGLDASSSGLPVHFQGLVTYADLEWNVLFLQDDTAGLYLAGDSIGFEPKSGDWVEVTGRTAAENQMIRVARPKLSVLDHRALPEAVSASEEDLLSGRVSARWVEVDCVVRKANQAGLRLKLEVLKGSLRLACYVRSVGSDFDSVSLVDSRIRVQGVCANRYRGSLIEGASLYIPTITQVTILTRRSKALTEMLVTPIREVASLLPKGEQADRVRIQGLVAGRSGNRFVLRDATGSIAVSGDSSIPIQIDDRLDVWGVPASLDHEAIMEDAVYVAAARGADEPAKPSGDQVSASAAPLRTIQEVRALSKAQAAERLRVEMEGVVTYADPAWRNFFLHDPTGDIYVQGWQDGLRPGQRIALTGVTDAGGLSRMIGGASLQVLGETNLPSSRRADLPDLRSAAFDCSLVELEGVVHSVDGDQAHSILRLVNPLGRFEALIPDMSEGKSLQGFVNARIRLVGVCSPQVNNYDQLVGVQLRIPHLNSIQVLERAPADPFAIEPRPIRAIAHGIPALLGPHRVRVQGMVTLVGPSHEFSLLDASGGIRVNPIQTNSVQQGDFLDAVGFPLSDGTSVHLEEALFRPERGKKPVRPKPLEAEDILAQVRYDRELIEIEGRLLSDAGGSTHPSLLVQSGTVVFQAQFEAPALTRRLPVWRSGSRIQLTGVCALQTNERHEPRSFVLVLRDPSDVRVIEQPPWWTPRHLMTAGVVLLALVFATLGWVGLLRRQVRDRSEQIRKRYEAEAAMEKRLSLVWENSADGMRMTDSAGTVVRVNRAYCEMMHRTREELSGKPYSIVYELEVRESLQANYREQFARRAIAIRQELAMVLWDGTRVWLEFSKTLFEQPGSPPLLLTQVRDITDRKRADEEKEQLQAQLLQAQKMESVGRLAGGVAHDFNNMLQVILGNAILALEEAPGQSKLREELQEILESAQRSADLTRQLLAFARKQDIKPEILDLNATISGMLKMLQRLIGENIQLAWLPATNLGPVKMDPSQIDQILVNLTVNARDAIDGVGKISIETANVVFHETDARVNPDCVPGDYVMLAVSDTGHGMDAHTREHLFEPFFTTKEVGKGTGLGLPTVFGIVKQNRGLIQVWSEPDRGTRFKIFFPRTRPEDVALPKNATHKSANGSETILLVEDEEQILNLCRRVLIQKGYTVLAARTPNDALKLAAEHRGRIHLVVTDIVMPGMNGKELKHRLEATQPGARTIYISGYTADIMADHGIMDEGVHFLQKPFTVGALTEKVRSVLEA